MGHSYFTILSPTKSLYKEKGSKFLGFAHPIKSEEEITLLIKSYKKEYYDARHVCSAFILGPKSDHYRSSDDGEPSNSAGPPILGQIRSFGLTNTAVIVVRYFGGTKLGVGGLVSAYKEAATACLAKAKKIERHPQQSISINFNYTQMNFVMRLVKEYDLIIQEQTFQAKCAIKVLCKESLLSELTYKLTEGQVSFAE